MDPDRTSPEELLSLIPHLLRSEPEPGVVTLHAVGPRFLGAAHAPIKRLRHPTFVHGLASMISTTQGSDVPLVALYLDLEVAAARASTHPGSVADRLRIVEGLSGVRLQHLWVIGTDGFYEHGCLDATCCPPQGRDLGILRAHPASLNLIAQGSAPRANIASAIPVPITDRDRLTSYRAGYSLPLSGPVKRAEVAADLLDTDNLSDHDAGRAARSLSDGAVLGALMRALLLSGLDLRATMVALVEDVDLGNAVQERISRGGKAELPPPAQPVWGRVRRNLTLICSLSPALSTATGMAALLAYLAWWDQDPLVAHRILTTNLPGNAKESEIREWLHAAIVQGAQPPWKAER